MLEFRDVWFGYDPHRPVLRDVSFQVPHHGHIALTERFDDPDRGTILFHGTELRALDRDHYRARVGLVEQHAPILYGTLRDNLTYTAPHTDEDELRRAIELANLTELVSRSVAVG